MSRPDGGPAFPAVLLPRGVDGATGMSLRDYFAAHAPAEPQPWFEPVMDEARPDVPKTDELSEDDFHHWRRCAEWCDPEDFEDRPALKKWLQRRNAAFDKAEAWDKERSRQRSIQWPYAWADAQLAERSKP